MSSRYCVYGGQFGSEGKGSFAEHLIQNEVVPNKPLLVIGENSPNSGHTNTKGKTRALPVSAWYADMVLLGPDSAIDPWILMDEIDHIRKTRNQVNSLGVLLPVVKIHCNAALIIKDFVLREQESDLVTRVASTATGGGWARTEKARYRRTRDLIGHFTSRSWDVVDQQEYDELLVGLSDWNWIFEGSQGMMLDLNLGYYPSVTSRSTHPRVAIERNGLGDERWKYCGVFRTYPIRTGGNSGITDGREVTWEELGLREEIATVTKRKRRVFEFSGGDFLRSIRWARPDIIAFTHLDYLQLLPQTQEGVTSFKEWLCKKTFGCDHLYGHKKYSHIEFMLSDTPGLFHNVGPLLW